MAAVVFVLEKYILMFIVTRPYMAKSTFTFERCNLIFSFNFDFREHKLKKERQDGHKPYYWMF